MRQLISVFAMAVLISCSTSGADPVEDLTDTPADAAAVDADVAPKPGPTALTVMTFNVLCSFCDNTYEPWVARLGHFADLFARHDPDLLGLQELFTPEEVEELVAAASGHAALFFAGVLGPLMLDFYPDATILYRADRFEVVESGFYWLSETPDEPWSGGWAETNLPRLVAWAHLRQIEDGRDLYFATTHFDNNTPNQDMSAPLFVERSRAWAAEMPAILTGDFNSQPYDAAYATLTEEAGDLTLCNTFEMSESWSVDHNQASPPDWDPIHRIDHILVAGDAPWSVPSWVVDLHVYGPDGLYPSDHFAMVARIEF